MFLPGTENGGWEAGFVGGVGAMSGPRGETGPVLAGHSILPGEGPTQEIHSGKREAPFGGEDLRGPSSFWPFGTQAARPEASDSAPVKRSGSGIG